MEVAFAAAYDVAEATVIGSTYGLAQGVVLGVVGNLTVNCLVRRNAQLEYLVMDGGLSGAFIGATAGACGAYQESGIHAILRSLR